MPRTKPIRLDVERGAMRVRAYPVLLAAVEDGVARGWRRAHKHADAPGEGAIRAAIEQAVVESIGERFDFPEDDDHG